MTSPGVVPTQAELFLARGIALTPMMDPTERAKAIAQALADQRARYEAVADELEAKLVLGAGRTAAERIRQVSR